VYRKSYSFINPFLKSFYKKKPKMHARGGKGVQHKTPPKVFSKKLVYKMQKTPCRRLPLAILYGKP
jgi:hypothetical protein